MHFQCSLEGSGAASGPPSVVLEKGQQVLIFFISHHLSHKGPEDKPETKVMFAPLLNPVSLV